MNKQSPSLTARRSPLTSRSGFSLIELLTVMGLIGIIAIVSLVILNGRKSTVELDLTAQKITALVREAQSRSMTQASSTSWGVHFSNGTTPYYALFSGGSYSTSTEEGHYPLPSGILFSGIGSNQYADIFFSQLSGQSSGSSTIDIYSTRNTSTLMVISVDPSGQASYTASSTVIIAAPTVSSASPSSLAQGASSQNVTIAGSGFQNGAVATFSGTGITVNSTTFNNASQVTVNLTVAGNATISARDITITNTDTQAGTCVSCFSVTTPISSPTVVSASPSSGSQGDTNLSVVVTGTGFVNGAAATFSGTGITVNSTTYNSATQLTLSVTIASGAGTGSRNITVTNPDTGAGTGTGVFTVNSSISSPTVTSASPSSGVQGATNLSVVVTGTGFASGAAATFSGTGITVNSTTFNSSTQLTLSVTIVGGAAIGSRNITVTNSDAGAGTGTGVFSVTAPISTPHVTSATPSSGAQGATGLSVVVAGTGFVTGAAVSFSGTGITVNFATFNSATQVTANITIASNATLGARSVTLTNADSGTDTLASGFTVTAPAPTVSSPSPSSRVQGMSSQNIVITGTGFDSGAAATFSGTGITVNSTTFNSSTQVTANITLASNATAGARDITVTNTDGGAGTGSSVFTVVATPVVVSTTPSSGAQGATGLSVALIGTGFQSGAVVSISGTGITLNSATFVSSTQITLNMDIGSTSLSGVRNITVTNTDGGSNTGTGVFTVTQTQQNTGYLFGSGTPSTTVAGAWVAPDNWFGDENPPTAVTQVARASTTSTQSPLLYTKGFSFGVPSGSSIDKICVLVNNASIGNTVTGATVKWNVALSWDGGTSVTTENAGGTTAGTTLTGTEEYFQDQTTVAGTTDPATACTNWGRTWSTTELSSSNFTVRLKATNSKTTAVSLRYDVLKVKVYYTPQ